MDTKKVTDTAPAKSYVVVAGKAYRCDTPEEEAEARQAIAFHGGSVYADLWAGDPADPSSYKTNRILRGEPRTVIAWGRGAAARPLADAMERADQRDWDLVQPHTFAAGLTDRSGMTMGEDVWVCVLCATTALEEELDADPAVIGYRTAPPRVGI
jgi:hypothetical protein